MGKHEVAMKKAIFLDRDGVLNELVFNPETLEYEPPHNPDDLILFPGITECLHSFLNAGYLLFIVSNQPDFAKGKVRFENIIAVHEKLNKILDDDNITITQYYYCYHHPRGIIPEYSIECDCRKPKPYFLLRAKENYSVDLSQSWTIGDRDTDIVCGQTAGTKTIMIEYPHSFANRGVSKPDFTAGNLQEAGKIILHT